MTIRLLVFYTFFALFALASADDTEAPTDKIDATDPTGENNDTNTTEAVTNEDNLTDLTGQTDITEDVNGETENSEFTQTDTVVENNNTDITTDTNDIDGMVTTNVIETDTSDLNTTLGTDLTDDVNTEETITAFETSEDSNIDENNTSDSDNETDVTEDIEPNTNVTIEDPLHLPLGLPPTCDSIIYCQGLLLHTVQMSRIFEDSKEFVDMSMVKDPGLTFVKFNELMRKTDKQPTKSQVETFVKEYFKTEDELMMWTPKDYDASPCFLLDIRNKEVKQFATNIIKIWKELGRNVTEHVFYHPDKYSLVPVPYGFIASGGRYKEYYYWDNYWIIDALIICGMTNTAKGMIDNFVTLILKYGFVPNGGRKYYVNRSQPPMLPFMVMRYYEETTDIIWLNSYIEYFEQELQFWLENRMTYLTVGDKEYHIGMYKSETKGPRPEAYYEDVTAAMYYETGEERQDYFNDIKASAESGWDSSSRWIFDSEGGTQANLTFSHISNVVPVDLNALLYGAFKIMSKLYLDLENYGKQIFWHKKATEMYVAINELFWNEEDGMWYDYDMKAKKQRKHFYASNLVPLWTGALNTTYCKKDKQVEKILSYLRTKGILNFRGGIPSSLQNTGKQWDMPNVWPPLQSMIVNGLYKTGVATAQKEARKLAAKFVSMTMKSFSEDGAMYQRYDAEEFGKPGPKGEYDTQKVFAWTNAVALQFIDQFYALKRM